MKTAFRVFTFLIILLFVSLEQADASSFNLGINNVKSFSLNENVSKPELRFFSSAPLEDIEGYVAAEKIKSSLKINPSDIESASGEVVFKVSGMKTGINKRDEHLRSSDWLNASEYPEISFKLNSFTNVKSAGGSSESGKASAEAVAAGDFSMHGKSRKMEIPVKMTYMKESTETKKRASGDFLWVEGSFKIVLAEYDINGFKGIIGSKVGEEIDVKFKLYYTSK